MSLSDEDRSDFNNRRHTFIGGSDIAGIMGLSRWNTPLSLWALKTQQYDDPFEMNEAVEFGIALEGFVSEKFAERTGKLVTVDETEYVHPDYPYLRAHIDRRVDGCEVLEVKTCSEYKSSEWTGEDIPNEYYLQLQWYLGIVGDTVGYMAVLVGGQKFIWKKVEFSQKLFDKQVEMAKEFWEEFVIPQIAPMASSGDQDVLMALHPESRSDDLQIVAGGDEETAFNNLAIDYLEGKSQIREIQKDVDAAGNQLRQLIADLKGLESGLYKSVWNSFDRSSVDVAALKRDGLYEAYTVKKPQRTLRVLEKSSNVESK